METTTFEVNGMSCGNCVAKLVASLEAVDGVQSVEAEVGRAVVSHEGACETAMGSAITEHGWTLGEFHWRDKSVWGKSAYNTMWCLIGCSIGDFGTIAAFQFLWPNSGWHPMAIMGLAMMNGLITSILLETFILLKQMGGLKAAFKVAIGMSLISMIGMEAAMNIVDLLMTGGAMLTPVVILPMLIAGFVTPWPYNYWRLKKFGKACH